MKFEDIKKNKQIELFDKEKSELDLSGLFPNYSEFIRNVLVVQPMPDNKEIVFYKKKIK